MDMKNIFGFGEKKKEPFKIPKHITDLRMKIAAELKENFPSSKRNDEIMRETDAVYASLNALIRQELYAAEAMRIKEDIDKKLEDLSKIIDKNRQTGKPDGKEDYLENNLDYLERKNMRNKAKTLFISVIEEIKSFEKYCCDENLEKGKTIESEAANLYQHVLALKNDFFKKHQKDNEIQGIRLELVRNMTNFSKLFNENKALFQNHGLAANVEASIKLILGE